MNNKIIGYEEAVERIKELNIKQKSIKGYRKYYSRRHPAFYGHSIDRYGKLYRDNKKEINYLLSIIDAHKKMRKMYEELRFQKDKNE